MSREDITKKAKRLLGPPQAEAGERFVSTPADVKVDKPPKKKVRDKEHVKR